jgi:hypothetical protein
LGTKSGANQKWKQRNVDSNGALFDSIVVYSAFAIDFFNTIDPERRSSANLFCTARFMSFDHFVGGGLQRFRDGEAELSLERGL